MPETGGDRKHPIFQDVQLRVISLTWAPSRSSYFSSFEVFIAEKWLNKKESEVIKLVYEFLPYQQRLSIFKRLLQPCIDLEQPRSHFSTALNLSVKKHL